ncbi:hypothetical protein [Rubripirellula amarantea]|nr:hypothetical protein [Rubripirellula amarantea]
MNTKTQRHLLTGLAAGFVLATAAAVYWSLGSIDINAESRSSSRQNSVDKVPLREPSADEFDATLANRSLRAPLTDSPKVVEPRKPPPPRPVVERDPVLRLTLVGTIINAAERIAIISDQTGKSDVKGVGDSLELSPAGITIKSIDSNVVTLEYRGTRTTVEIEQPEGSPTTSSAKPSNRFRSGGRGR